MIVVRLVFWTLLANGLTRLVRLCIGVSKVGSRAAERLLDAGQGVEKRITALLQMAGAK